MSNMRSRAQVEGEAGTTRGHRRDDRETRGRGTSHRGLWQIVNRARLAGFTLPTLGLFFALGGMVALTLGTGCASKKTPPADASTTAPLASASSPAPSVLDVHPAPARAPTIMLPAEPVITPDVPSAVAPGVPPAAPLAQDPVLTQTPSLASAGAGPASAAAASTYTVQKGDTLFKIAREHYGDGKQWSRIVAANPGLSPASLKAGQKLNLP